MNQNKDLTTSLKNRLLQNATNASSEGITISSMSSPEQPLIFVNEGFQRLTGYPRNEVIGKNCRFLQGIDTDPQVVQQLREAIAKKEACTVELLNYKKNGTPFWNRLSITPVYDENNVVTHYVGIQSDITALKETKASLEAANEELSEFRDKMVNELEQARRMQQFLLPSKLPEVSKVRFASLFVPMDAIGGDFFDVIELGNQRYGILIADVTGHGIPAALLTFMSSTTFKYASAEATSPADVIRLTNEKLYQKMPEDAFVTMFYGVYDANNNTLNYVQAGHPEGYVVRANSNQIIALETGGTIVGAFSSEDVEFKERQLKLQPGDKLVVYTDAISDAIDNLGKADKKIDFKSILLNNAEMPLEKLFKHIYEYGLNRSEMKSYMDDFTLVGMTVLK